MSASLLLTAPFAGGCLSAQEIELIEQFQPFNLPPVIDLTQVEPPQPVVCVSALEPIEFRLENVRDPNGPERQELSVRWFVDYSLAESDSPGSDQSKNIIKTENLGPVEEGSDVYTPVVLRSSEIQRLLTPNETHVVEAVISDGFSSTGEPRNRAVREGFYATSYKWTVQFFTDRHCF